MNTLPRILTFLFNANMIHEKIHLSRSSELKNNCRSGMLMRDGVTLTQNFPKWIKVPTPNCWKVSCCLLLKKIKKKKKKNTVDTFCVGLQYYVIFEKKVKLNISTLTKLCLPVFTLFSLYIKNTWHFARLLRHLNS